MGCRQAKPDSTYTASDKETAQLRKKVCITLEKSREKYLSAVLDGSETDLRKKGSEIQCAAKEGSITDNGVKPGSQSSPEGAAPLVESEDSRESSSSSSCSSDTDVEPPMHASVRKPILRPIPRRSKDSKKRGGLRRERHSFHPLGRYDRSSSFYDDVDRQAFKTNPADYTYEFENLVFEGGGNKGLAYCGAVRYLEELGVMQKVKRFAGASAGGMVAGLLALGYTSYEIEDFLSDRIDRVFLDASCGYLSLLPNILRSFGWNPGKKIYRWFGAKIEEKTGDADYTFQQLYQNKGIILCIIVTNLSQMTTEYCHPKTTPDMPIRMALRMSMAIPGLFSAMKYKHLGVEDIYVDGGVLCNYPVHCFDGWYLSMDPKDSFLRKLQPLRDIPIIMERHNRFGAYNDRTVGMLLYSDAEEDILRINLERRVGCLEPARPNPETKLFTHREKEAKQKRRAEREYAQVVQAVESFLRVLKKHNMDDNDVINREELEAAFKDEEEFPRSQAKVLFGDDFTVNEVFCLLDRDNNKKIRYEELLRFIEENGVCLQSRFLGYQRREIKNFVGFLNTLTSTLTFNVQKLYVEERDLERTVGINTGHIQTTDFVLEQPDRDFIVQRGYNSMKAFLKYFVVCKPDKVTLKSDCDTVFQEEDMVTDPSSTDQNACGHPDILAPLPADHHPGSREAQELVPGGSGARKSPKRHKVSWKSDQVELVVRNGRGSPGVGVDEVDLAEDVIVVHQDMAGHGGESQG